jgi:hypothetical protein
MVISISLHLFRAVPCYPRSLRLRFLRLYHRHLPASFLASCLLSGFIFLSCILFFPDSSSCTLFQHHHPVSSCFFPDLSALASSSVSILSSSSAGAVSLVFTSSAASDFSSFTAGAAGAAVLRRFLSFFTRGFGVCVLQQVFLRGLRQAYSHYNQQVL